MLTLPPEGHVGVAGKFIGEAAELSEPAFDHLPTADGEPPGAGTA
jgi:hypothetical protein